MSVPSHQLHFQANKRPTILTALYPMLYSRCPMHNIAYALTGAALALPAMAAGALSPKGGLVLALTVAGTGVGAGLTPTVALLNTLLAQWFAARAGGKKDLSHKLLLDAAVSSLTLSVLLPPLYTLLKGRGSFVHDAVATQSQVRRILTAAVVGACAASHGSHAAVMGAHYAMSVLKGCQPAKILGYALTFATAAGAQLAGVLVAASSLHDRVQRSQPSPAEVHNPDTTVPLTVRELSKVAVGAAVAGSVVRLGLLMFCAGCHGGKKCHGRTVRDGTSDCPSDKAACLSDKAGCPAKGHSAADMRRFFWASFTTSTIVSLGYLAAYWH